MDKVAGEEDQRSVRVGLLGELEVELQLVLQGWHPVRLDTAQMASNADLLAVNKEIAHSARPLACPRAAGPISSGFP